MATETPARSGFNPYAAPRSQVEDRADVAEGEPAYFPVSRLKLAVMSLVTFNLYLIYWYYQNWKCAQRLHDEKLSAPIRSLFYAFTSYSLFRRIRDHAREVHVHDSLQAGSLAVAVFVLAAIWRIPDPYWLVTFLGFLPLFPVQSVVNEVNRKVAPGADANNRFRGWNIVGLVVGGPLFFLSVLGTLLGYHGN